MKIGVISDTHNYFHPRIPEVFKGVEHILHAGDVGQQKILFDLEAIAPVTAVFGNTDCGLPLRETEVVELAGRKILIHHIVDVLNPSETVRRRIDLAQPDVVVFGHTHEPFQQIYGRTLYLNPGAAGKKRFNYSHMVAILHCDEKEMRVEFVPL